MNDVRSFIAQEDYEIVDVHYRGGPLAGTIRQEGLLEHMGIPSAPIEIWLDSSVVPLFGAVYVLTYGPVQFDTEKNEHYRVCWSE